MICIISGPIWLKVVGDSSLSFFYLLLEHWGDLEATMWDRRYKMEMAVLSHHLRYVTDSPTD